MEDCGRKIGPYPCCSIITGDAKELAKAIPDESVDLIFTDPPWSPDSIGLFGWMASEAERMLSHGGWLLTFCGKNRFDFVLSSLSATLDFYWPIAGYQPQSDLVFNPRRILEKWRPALLYSKGYEPTRSRFMPDLYPTNRDKRFHDWGQGEEFWLFYLSVLSEFGNTVFDPFCGGGTVPAVCKKLGLHWLSFEIDAEVSARARERVSNTQPPLFVVKPEQMTLPE